MNADEGTVLVTVDNDVATITLNRPDIHNAMDDQVIARLTRELRDLGEDDDVRAVILAARGRSFCAGADLNYMKRTAGFSEAENAADARALADLLYNLSKIPKPTLALVQGSAIGGGVGLVCACDIAIAAESAFFSFSEVRLGLVPAVISPFVVGSIGPSRARRYILSGERVSAHVAERIGLVHEAVPDEALRVRGKTIVDAVLRGGPAAHAAAKDLIDSVHGQTIDDALMDNVAKRIARSRVSEEGQEGMAAFLEKRKPRWRL